MPYVEEEKANETPIPVRNPSPNLSSKKNRAPSWSDIWPLKRVVFTMQLPESLPDGDKTLISNFSRIDRTLLLSDDILLRILSKLPFSQRNANSLVCKRWLNLQGRLVRSLRVLDWEFLESGRLISRFPNLSNVDLVVGCFVRRMGAGVFWSHRLVSLHIDSCFSRFCDDEGMLLPVEIIDRGLKALACGCPNLRRLVVVGASEFGLLSVAEECLTLQELELHKCGDNVLRGIAACENLQILKLVGNVEGFYNSTVSDIGLTILAQGCKRLVKLELSSCEGSFDGIKAIGQCCQMLEELTFSDHRMDDGWLAALSYCENLKTLRFVSCKKIDPSPGPDEYLGSCLALERLHLQKCQLRDKKGVRALFRVCEAVRELVFQDCWGLDDDIFRFANVFRFSLISVFVTVVVYISKFRSFQPDIFASAYNSKNHEKMMCLL